jgi:hypothetical protein
MARRTKNRGKPLYAAFDGSAKIPAPSVPLARVMIATEVDPVFMKP